MQGTLDSQPVKTGKIRIEIGHWIKLHWNSTFFKYFKFLQKVYILIPLSFSHLHSLKFLKWPNSFSFFFWEFLRIIIIILGRGKNWGTFVLKEQNNCFQIFFILSSFSWIQIRIKWKYAKYLRISDSACKNVNFCFSEKESRSVL